MKPLATPGGCGRRLIVIDQLLSGLGGHHYECDAAVALAAEAAGWVVVVAGSTRFGTGVIPGCRARVVPWFRRPLAPGRPSTLRRITASLPSIVRAPIRTIVRRLTPTTVSGQPIPDRRFAEDLHVMLTKSHRGDVATEVFVHTIALAELVAFADMIEAWRAEWPSRLRFHVMLRRDPAEMGAGWPGRQPDEVLQRLAAFGPSRVHFLTDTIALARAFERLAPVRLAIAPVFFRQDWLDAALARRPRNDRITLAYLGDARREKGFHLLPGLIRELLRTSNKPLHFIVQSRFNVPGGESGIAGATAELKALGPNSVSLVDEELPPEAYYDLLTRADIVLLPYQPDGYRIRSSGVLVQALVAGKPVIVARGTWLADEVLPDGGRCYDSDLQFARATQDLIDNLSPATAAAMANASRYREEHHTSRLIAQLGLPVEEMLAGR